MRATDDPYYRIRLDALAVLEERDPRRAAKAAEEMVSNVALRSVVHERAAEVVLAWGGAKRAHALVEHAPERLLWASNWPHPSLDEPPAADDLRRLLVEWLPDPDLRRRVLVDHPVEVYGFDPLPDDQEEPS